jgi:hypothetical protein
MKSKNIQQFKCKEECVHRTQMPQSSANIKHKDMSLVAGTGFL